MNPRTFHDLRQRYNITSSEYEKTPYQHQKMPITDIEVDDVDYARPYWVAPDLAGEHGNHFNLLSLVSAHLDKLGFRQESEEFKEVFFESMKKNHTTIYQLTNKFVNYFDSISEKVIDGEAYIKIEKQPKEFEQLPEFKNVTLESVKKLHSNGFDFNQTNVYGRDILFYVKDRDTMEWLFNNVYDINKSEDYMKLFQLDVFNCSLLIKQNNPAVLDFILEKMFTKETEFSSLIQKWCVGVDTFSRCMEDSIVKNLNTIFAKDQNFTQYADNVTITAKLFSKINKVYPEFTNAIINTGSEAFKSDPVKLSFWKKNMEIEYLDQSLQLRKPDSEYPKTKRLKL